MVNQKKPTYDMETLNTDIDTVINNSEQVYFRITNWFSTWFFLDLNDCQPLHSTEDWQEVYNN